MKKLFLSLFVAGALTFGLQSCDDKDDTDPCADVTCGAGEVCENGDCIPDPNAVTCDECGTYQTSAYGHMKIANGAVLDTTWVEGVNEVSIPAEFIKTGNDYSLSVDLSGVSAVLADPIAVEGDYNTSTKIFTVTNFEYNVAGIADVLVNGTADFSVANTTTGSLAITAPQGASVPVDGQLDFAGTK